MRIENETLCEAIHRAESGLIDADLGGSILKQRVALPGQGRSGGHRVLIGYRCGARAVFMYGFAKNERENIDEDELVTLREIAAEWLEMDSALLKQALAEGRAEEINCD